MEGEEKDRACTDEVMDSGGAAAARGTAGEEATAAREAAAAATTMAMGTQALRGRPEEPRGKGRNREGQQRQGGFAWGERMRWEASPVRLVRLVRERTREEEGARPTAGEEEE